MLGITNIWTYLLGTVAIVLLPGPNSMLVLSVAARQGVRPGYRAACGVFLGDGVLMLLSASGVAALLRAQPELFLVVKYAGAVYLCWIGLGLIRGALRRRRPRDSRTVGTPPATTPAVTVAPGADQADTVAPGADRVGSVAPGADRVGSVAPAARPVGTTARGPFRRSLLVSLLNPKAILFFISFFIQFVEPGYHRAWLSFLLLGALAELISLTYLTVLIFTGSYLAAQFHRRRRLAAALTAAVGTLFIGFAVRLATASLG